MTEQEKVIVESLKEQIASGKIKLEDLPQKWRELVEGA